jgi:NAD(P)-dependent dehydrogenase (short-subunit alcohol dehydrogenase family)
MFAKEGARIIGCDIHEGAAERAAAALREQGHDVRGYTLDLTDAEAAKHWIDEAAAVLGGIDVLYNNAAGYGFAPFAEMDLQTWRHVMRGELDIVFHTTQPAWRHMSVGAVPLSTRPHSRPFGASVPEGKSHMPRPRVGSCLLPERSLLRAPHTVFAQTRSRQASSRRRRLTRRSMAP